MKEKTMLWAALVAAGSVGIWACSTDEGNGQTYDVSIDTDATGDMQTDACTSTDPFCSADLRQVMQCDPATGGMTVLMTCASGTVCVAGSCQAAACDPNSALCLNESTSQVCREDGSGWDVVPCPDYQKCDDESGFCEFPCMLRVFVLIDQSGSMGGDTHPTKWEQARTAMTELVAAESAASVEFGLGVFPSGGESCGTSAQVVYPIPVDPVDLIDQYFGSHSPSGNTPLLAALQFHVVDTAANLNDPAYYNYLLVISDGADTCYDDHCEVECGLFDIRCLTECEERAELEVITELAGTTDLLHRSLQIRTFVIGFGEGVSPEELDAIALNGGTELGRWLVASDVTELSAAFDQILAEMLECNPIVL
jgi:hypothetical protein